MSRGLYGSPCHWRSTMQPARMLVWDARLFPVVLLVILHFRLWTVVLAAAVLSGALLIQRRGMTIPSALRRLRAKLAGRRRRATSMPPRRPACWSDECADGWRWNPSNCRAVPPPRWLRAGIGRLEARARERGTTR